MATPILRPSRLAAINDRSSIEPHVAGLPALPAIDWSAGGYTAPALLDTPPQLPKADVVIITWAGAEWAALQHVFCTSTTPMSYANRHPKPFNGWQQDADALPAGGPADWTFWGYHRLVQVGDKRVLLVKSNTHLDWPGQTILTSYVNRLIDQCNPSLLLSIGTAGGTIPTDHVGTVRLVSGATLYNSHQPAASWPTYASHWHAPSTILNDTAFANLLMPIPITQAALGQLRDQLDTHEQTTTTLAELDPAHLNEPDPHPQIHNQTHGTETLLTADSFVVGTIDGDFKNYACIEMDDAIVASACTAKSLPCGFVRNISDPAQNNALPVKTQGAWGSTIYDAYGLYTSYNGALASWAVIA